MNHSQNWSSLFDGLESFLTSGTSHQNPHQTARQAGRLGYSLLFGDSNCCRHPPGRGHKDGTPTIRPEDRGFFGPPALRQPAILRDSTDRSAPAHSRGLSRYGQASMVEEILISFRQTTAIDLLLPGVERTGKPVELAVAVIVGYKDGKIYNEHSWLPIQTAKDSPSRPPCRPTEGRQGGPSRALRRNPEICQQHFRTPQGLFRRLAANL